MGCGKSTVGKLLAQKLNMRFIDLDDYIEETEGMKIPDIFKEKGEPYFRSAEAKAVEELSAKDTVIACGGGTILNDYSAEIARKNGVVVFLDIPFEVSYERIKDDSNRPLVMANTKESLNELFNKRHDIYKKNSSVTIDADCAPAQLCDCIVKTVKAIIG